MPKNNNNNKINNKFNSTNKKYNNSTTKKASPKQKNKTPRPYYNKKNEVTGKVFMFKMPADMYDMLATECKKKHLGDTQTYLCDYVNSQFRLLGTCIGVIRG